MSFIFLYYRSATKCEAMKLGSKCQLSSSSILFTEDVDCLYKNCLHLHYAET